MSASLGKAAALQPLVNRVAAFQKHVQDIVFTAQSQTVVLGLQLYALLRKRAAANTELTAALAPATTFFAYRHPSTKAPGTLTKPQKKATTKALATVKKNAPEMLQPAGGDGGGAGNGRGYGADAGDAGGVGARAGRGSDARGQRGGGRAAGEWGGGARRADGSGALVGFGSAG